MKKQITCIKKILMSSAFLIVPFSMMAQSWDLVWSDEFEGTALKTTIWNIEVNDFGGYNNELQYYSDRSENVRVEDGNLIIEARAENYNNRNYTSGRINSKGKKSFKYGKIEARMKLPYGNGVWPAFWMMGNTGNWPACGEIDIMELVGGTQCGYDCGDNKTHGYMWWSDNGDKSSGTRAPLLASGKYADDYHTFGIEWDEESIKWFIDDTQFHSESITGTAKTEFHQPFYFLLNFAVGGDWPGSPTQNTVFPQKMYVDYVRVYEKSVVSNLTEADKHVDFNIYPNPIESNLTVETSGFNQSQYKITDITGKEYFSGDYKEVIDISTLPSGLYLFYLMEGEKVACKKFSKK